MAAKKKSNDDKIEILKAARAAAIKLFGDKVNADAVFAIAEELEECDDRDEFAQSLSYAYEIAKDVFETDKPDPDEVFGTHEALFG